MIKILLEFTNIFQDCRDLNEIYASLESLLRTKFGYKYIATYISDNEGTFSLSIKSEFNAQFKDDLNQTEKLASIFSDQKIKVIDTKIRKLFCKTKVIQSGILLPLISDNYLFGIIAIGMNKKYDFSNDIKTLTNINQMLSILLRSAIKYNSLRLHNKYLQDISSKVRHDLRNHLQIIGLSHDILKDTKLSEEQIGYLEKISKGLEKASNVINEQIKLKSKFNEEIDQPLGLLLGKKNK